jgi:glycosyltransferase involved in cell wall biosynthesis
MKSTRRLALVTDAWAPQVNGVVRTLESVAHELPALGVELEVVHPGQFRTLPMPGYREIPLSLTSARAVGKVLARLDPDAVHIATEGPLGWAARRACRSSGRPFTTAYHTKFPEYVKARIGLPLGLGHALLRRFHHSSTRVLVATPTVRAELERRRYHNLAHWGRGVDLDLFRPGLRGEVAGLERPIFLSVGRLAIEKNLEAFLALELPGTKVVVGDGPDRARLERLARGLAHFPGSLGGEPLARWYASADAFVFPSLTDTFGLVLLEALASGTPVAAFPVAGPLDVIGDAPVGVLGHDLAAAARRALELDRGACRRFAEGFGWRASAQQLVDAMAWRSG